MNDLIEVPEDLCKARGVAAGKARLPNWILLYTVAPAGGQPEAEAAEIRTACKLVRCTLFRRIACRRA